MAAGIVLVEDRSATVFVVSIRNEATAIALPFIRWIEEVGERFARAFNRTLDRIALGIRELERKLESELERKQRLSRDSRILATARLRRFGLPALTENQWFRPLSARRACGEQNRWTVML